MGTVTDKYYQTLFLSDFSQQNNRYYPATAGFYVANGDGVVGTAGFAWTIGFGGVVSSTVAGGHGIYLKSGGFVTNGHSGSSNGLITGAAEGIRINSATGTVLNFGTVTGTTGSGVYLRSGGTVFNPGTITTASTLSAVHLSGAGAVSNSGTIKGGVGVLLSGPGHVTAANSGLVLGGAGGGVSMTNGANSDTLTNSGTIVATGIGVSGGVVINSGTIVGSTGVVAGYVTNAGTQTGASIVNTGTIIGTSGAAVVFTPTLAETITNYGTIGSGTAGTAIAFGAGADVLVVGTTSAIFGTLTGFNQLDTIDLAQRAANGAVFTGTTAGGTLTVTNNGSLVNTFVLAGRFSSSSFAFASDGNGGTNLTLKQPTGPVISGQYYLTKPVFLTDALSQNPLTVTSTGILMMTGTHAIVGTAGFPWTVTNLGTALANSAGNNRAIYLTAGGFVTNGRSDVSTALLSGGQEGVRIAGFSGTLVNFGTIAGIAGASVYIPSGGTLKNFGTITTSAANGSAAVNLHTTGTVTNTGTIIGPTGAFLSGGGITLTNSGLITATNIGVTGGALINQAAGRIIGTTGVIAGYVTVGGAKVGAPIVNYGTITSINGLALGFYAGAGAETITNFGTISALGNGTAVRFGGGADLLVLKPNSVLTGTIGGFSKLDTIDLAGTVATGATFSGNSAGGILTLTNAGTIVDTFALAGAALGSNVFTVQPDGAGGTKIANQTTIGNPVTGRYYNAVVLSDPSTQAQLSVSSTGAISVYSPGGPTTALSGSGYPWALVNLGSLTTSFGNGVQFTTGASVTNGKSGSTLGYISGRESIPFANQYQPANGVRITGFGIVTNFGTIFGFDSLNNDAGASIYANGILLDSGTVLNYGSIGSTTNILGGFIGIVENAGVFLGNGTVVNNGTITSFSNISSAGVELRTGALTNTGRIQGNSGVRLGASGVTVIDNSGTVLGGSGGGVVATGSTSVTTRNSGLILATATGAGVVGGTLINLNAGRISGTTGVIAGYVTANGTKLGAPIVNYGTITGINGVGVAFYNGNAPGTITNFGTIRIVGVGSAVVFGGGADVLVVEPNSVLSGTLAGFTEFDKIDLALTPATNAVFSGTTAGGTLTVMNNGVAVNTFLMAGRFTANGFAVSPDGHGGSNVTIRQPAGYATGTYYQTGLLTNPATQNPLTLGPTGLITAASGDGVLGTTGYDWTLTNLGTIKTSAGNGIRFPSGGSVANGKIGATTALISGFTNGVEIDGTNGTVVNFATISAGANAAGVLLGSAGTGVISNAGAISAGSGGTGVSLPGTFGGTISNAGTITAGLLGIAAGGAKVSNSGTITAGSGGGVTLANGQNAGSLNNSGTIVATGIGVSGGVLTNSGVISGSTGVVAGYVTTGGIKLAALVTNTGTINGTSGPAVVLNGTLAQTLVNYGTIGSSTAGTAVKLGNAADVLVIGPNSALLGTITGFNQLDTIDLAKTQATGAIFSGNTAGGTLTITNAGTIVDVFSLAGTLSSNVFALSPDGAGGVDVRLKQPLGNIIGTTISYTVLLSFAQGTTLTSAGKVLPVSGDGFVNILGTAGTLINQGTVAASASASHGVYLASGGIVTNTRSGVSGGYISGVASGVFIGGGPGTIGNSGTIRGGSGVVIGAGGATTVSNSGTIAGTAGTAVSLGGGSNRLIVSPGATFQGVVDGGGGSSVLEVAGLAAGAGPLGSALVNAIVNIGSVRNFSQLQVDFGQPVDIGGNLSFTTLTNQGTVKLASGNSLTLDTVAAAANPGVVLLQSGGLVRFQAAVATNQTVLLDPAGGAVEVDAPAHFKGEAGKFNGTIGNFAAVDKIDLATVGFSLSGTVNLLPGNVLQVSENSQNYVLQLDPAQNFAGQVFDLASDGTAGTAITVSAGPVFGVTTPLMTNTSGTLVFDSVVSGQIAFTTIGGLGPEWQFNGSGFLLGDGNPGFLIRNTAGAMFVGEVVNGVAVYTGIGGVGSEWDFEGNRDFLNDGQSQFLIRANQSSGAAGTLALGEVKNGATTFKLIGGLGVEWDFAGDGNFLSDGRQGFLIRANANSAATGALYVGEVVNNTAQFTSIGGLGLEWDFKLTGDFLGDGHTAFLIRAGQQSAAAGSLYIGEVEQGNLQFTSIGGVGPEWEFVASGHYVDTTKDDFLLRNTGSGALVVGSVSGLTVNASAGYTTVGGIGAEWNFHTTNLAVLA